MIDKCQNAQILLNIGTSLVVFFSHCLTQKINNVNEKTCRYERRRKRVSISLSN